MLGRAVRAEARLSELAATLRRVDEEEEPEPVAQGEPEGPQLLRDLEKALRAARDASAGRAVPPPSAPTVTRFYETTCIDLPGSGAAVDVMSIPQRPDLVAAWHTQDQYLVSAGRVAEGFGFDRGDYRGADHRGITPELLVPAILYTRPDHCATYSGPLPSEEQAYEPEVYVLKDLPKFASFVRSADRSLYLFAARVAHEPLVPVEGSPARAISLAKVAGSAGADMALVLSGVHDPIVLVSTPFVVIAMGAATGLSAGLFRGLNEGIYRRVVQWLTGTDPATTESGDDSVEA